MPYVLFFILYRKTPKIGDELHISDEMKRVNIVVLCSLMVYIMIVVISGVLGIHQNIFAISMCLSSSTWLFLACLIHTRWVLQHINKWMYHSLDSLTQQSRLRLENLPSRLASFMEDASSVFARGTTERSINESATATKSNTERDGDGDGDGDGDIVYLELEPPSTRLDLTIAAQTHSNTMKNAGHGHGGNEVVMKKKEKRQRDENPLRKRDVIEVMDNEVTFNLFVQHLNGEFSLGMLL